ncbi:hypothetical protein ABBQ38_005269 [Trebouxia sp. C0009 RCD-2024]
MNRLFKFTQACLKGYQLRVVLKPYTATDRHKVFVSSRCVLGSKQPLNLHPSKVRPGASLKVQSGTAIFAVLRQDLPLILYEALVAAILATFILYYQQRPRGWSARDLIQVGESPVAGQGLFATVSISKGQVLGAYPGVPRSADSMLQKASVAPNCKRYVFQTDSHVWLDPTDSAGLLIHSPNSSILSWKWDASMADVNEPPAGRAVNVEIVDGVSNLDLIFRATCDIPAGSELFLDYGKTYDRSSYK